MAKEEVSFEQEAFEFRRKLKEAKERQLANRKQHPADVHDAERKAAELAFRANPTPASLLQQTEQIDMVGGVAGIAPAIQPALPQAGGAITFLKATEKVDKLVAKGSGQRIFAPDWKALKDILKQDRIDQKSSGSHWLVERHEVPVNAVSILGFFDGVRWPAPNGTVKEQFEAIVDSDRVYRTDPE